MATKKAVKKETTEVKETKEIKGEKKLSSQTILMIISLVLVVAVIGIYVFKWHILKNEDTPTESYLLKSNTIDLKIKNLEEVPQVLSDAPAKFFVLITYTGTKENNELEKNLETLINKYELNSMFYYLNIDSIKKEDNYITQINNAFNTDKIKAVPTIIYFENGSIYDIATRDDGNPLNAGDFQRLLDRNYFESR